MFIEKDVSILITQKLLVLWIFDILDKLTYVSIIILFIDDR